MNSSGPNSSGNQEYYEFGGVTFSSPLPLLVRPATTESREVSIHWGGIPESLPDPEASGYLWQASKSAFLLKVDKVARYLVQDGEKIIIDPDPDADERAIRVFLMSTPMAALFYQRGLLPLHASAISYNNSGIAFAGPTGSGKSTLTAFLHHLHGYGLLADDVCVIHNTDHTFVIHPCASYNRLWAKAVKALKLSPLQYQQDVVKNKLHVAAATGCDMPAILRRIYILKDARTTTQISIKRIKGVQAVHALAANSFRVRQAAGVVRTEKHLQTCASLANTTEIFEFFRPLSFKSMDRALAILNNHLRELDNG